MMINCSRSLNSWTAWMSWWISLNSRQETSNERMRNEWRLSSGISRRKEESWYERLLGIMIREVGRAWRENRGNNWMSELTTPSIGLSICWKHGLDWMMPTRWPSWWKNITRPWRKLAWSKDHRNRLKVLWTTLLTFWTTKIRSAKSATCLAAPSTNHSFPAPWTNWRTCRLRNYSKWWSKAWASPIWWEVLDLVIAVDLEAWIWMIWRAV